VVFSERIEQCRYLDDLRVVELLDGGRQHRVEFCQRIPLAQHGLHFGQVVIGRARCRIGRELLASLLGAIRRAQHVLERFDDLDLERGVRTAIPPCARCSQGCSTQI